MNQLIVPKSEAAKEVKKELSMRRMVWKMADSKKDRFVDLTQQRRFDTMKELGNVLEVMTDQEWQHYLIRVEQKQRREQQEQEALARQQSLFS